jgi:hypothetical protein
MKKRGEKGEARILKVVNANLYHVAWRDNKIVNLISTVQPLTSDVSRNTSIDGVYSKVTIPQPHIVRHYNTGMGGVDQCDQKLAYYKTSVRTKKWPTKMLFHFLYVGLHNAHVLMREKKELVNEKDDGFTLLSFLDMLCDELLHLPHFSSDECSSTSSSVKRKAEWEGTYSRLDSVKHFPIHEKLPEAKNSRESLRWRYTQIEGLWKKYTFVSC